MTFWKWSTTAASNATADSTATWPEGMAASSVNDSARGVMAALAKYRDDTNGSIATGGSSTAYTVTSNQGFTSLALMDNAVIAFSPHTTSGAAPTLAVDGLTAKKIRMYTGEDMPSGVLVSGTPYVATYNNSGDEFLLHNMADLPWSVPIGALLPYTGSSAPTSSFALPIGQAISRTTYATLFGRIGTAFGSGDGSTTFNLPDLAGRIPMCLDNISGSAVGRVTVSGSGVAATTLGGTGGSQNSTLATANLPAYTPTGSISNGAITISFNTSPVIIGTSTNGVVNSGGEFGVPANIVSLTASASQAASTFTGTAQGGTATSFTNMPPVIALYYIIRVL